MTTREFCASQAKREAPTALAFAGLVTVALFVADIFERDGIVTTIAILHLTAIFTLGVTWTLVRGSRLPATGVAWVMSVQGLVLVGVLLGMALYDRTAVSLAYVLMVMLAYCPFVLDRLALFASAVPALIGFVAVVPEAVDTDQGQWYLAGVAALAMGLAVQRIRLRGIDALSRANDQLHDMATRDLLTGALNRQGLDEQLPGLVAAAARRGECVFAVFVDIDGLKAANDDHGHEFGDQVIVTVAGALTDVVRSTDLVVRWAGDEFLVIGFGQAPMADAWRSRLNENLASREDLTGWSRKVSVGVADAPAPELDFDALARAADEHMYDLRRERRDGRAHR